MDICSSSISYPLGAISCMSHSMSNTDNGIWCDLLVLENGHSNYVCMWLLLCSAPHYHVFFFHMFNYCIHIFKPFLSAVNTVGNIIGTHKSSYILMGVSSNIISSSLKAADNDVVNLVPYSWSKSIRGFSFSFSMKSLSNSLPMLTV